MWDNIGEEEESILKESHGQHTIDIMRVEVIGTPSYLLFSPVLAVFANHG